MNNLKKCLMLCMGIMVALSTLNAEEQQKKSLLPDYKQKVGFTYGVGADLVSNYVWRGLYVGGMGVQAAANVGYGGLFLDMWWNLGATDWTFKNTGYNANVKAFNPEVDVTLGFSRWGLTLMYMQMHYFDNYVNEDGSLGGMSKFFDYGNKRQGAGGITQEWRLKYRVSDALPISILWCTRTFGRDGYLWDTTNDQYVSSGAYYQMEQADKQNCELRRAYSSYLELGYDIYMPHNLCLEARVGMTPWRSMYTLYQGKFAVTNVSAKLNWHRDISEHCRMTAFANLMLNPYDIANGQYITGQAFLWNVGCGFYLK